MLITLQNVQLLWGSRRKMAFPKYRVVLVLACFFVHCCAGGQSVTPNSDSDQHFTYSHDIVVSECDENEDELLIYKFNILKNTKVILSDHQFILQKVYDNDQYEVVLASKNRNKFRSFNLTIKHLMNGNLFLTVKVSGQIENCNSHHSPNNCTALVATSSCFCLLFFGAFAITLIVLLKGRRLSCIHQLKQRGYEDENKPPISHIEINGIKCENLKDSDDSPSPDIRKPTNLPRKSSLKPPRMDAFPMPDLDSISVSSEPGPDQIPDVILYNGSRRKSMVTFNEKTEIRIS